jgi:hypothetical protein
MSRRFGLTLAALCLGGCSFFARGPDAYRTAVRELLEQKRPDVQSCYKASYEADAASQGRVVAKFQVEPKTGKLVKPEVVPAGTTANEALQQCVLSALNGLALTPPDQRTGDATFVWDFAR